MGRTFTNTGISINFGGTTAPTWNLKLQNGTASGEISVDNSGQLSIFTASAPIVIESSNEDVSTYGGTLVKFTTSNGTIRFRNDITVIAELDQNGNLKIAGTLGTGISF